MTSLIEELERERDQLRAENERLQKEVFQRQAQIDRLVEDVSRIRTMAHAERDQLKTALRECVEVIPLLQLHMVGRIKTRDMGRCEKCHESTSSGMDRVCGRCTHNLAKEALTKSKELIK